MCAVLDLLTTFMQASGMMLNKGKSNTAPQSQRFLTRTLGFTLGAFPSKYLGMPLLENVARTSCWKALLTKIQKCMLNWSFRALNMPSRVILLCVVLQAIPIYQLLGMACPIKTCVDLVSLYKKFLWQGAQEKQKWALLSWEKLILAKSNGGLGLWDPFILNHFMGAKIWFWWLQGGVALW